MTATSTYEAEQRMVLGADTCRTFAQVLTPVFEKLGRDPWVARMMDLSATVVSNSADVPLDWPGATVARGDAADVIARLKEESEVPLRSHGGIALNRALTAAAWSTASRSRSSP